MDSSGAKVELPREEAPVQREEPSASRLRASDVAEDAPRAIAGKRVGRYSLLFPIASGGMAQVWAAKPEGGGLARTVAIKLVRPEYASDEEYARMFIDEAMVASSIHHPNVCEIHELGRDGDLLFMVLEWVAGDSLSGLVQRGSELRPLPDAIAARIVADACAGLHAAHEAIGPDGQPLGIVHRDVSPHNVLLGREGQVKLADFGLSDSRTNRTVREPHMVGGKFGYLAPEVVKQKPSDHRVDVFAMGIVLWETLVGRRLFHHEDDRETLFKVMRCEVPRLAEVGVEAPEVVQRLLDGLLEPDPDARIPDASTAAREIQRAIDAVSEPVGPQQVAEVVELHLLGMGGFVDGSARRIRDSESRELDPHGRRTSIPDLDEAERSRPSLTG